MLSFKQSTNSESANIANFPITTDECLFNISEDACLKSIEKPKTVSNEVLTENKHLEISSTKSSTVVREPSYENTETAIKSRAVKVVETDKYLIITLSTCRRKDLPKPRSTQLPSTKISENKSQLSKVKVPKESSNEASSIVPSPLANSSNKTSSIVPNLTNETSGVVSNIKVSTDSSNVASSIVSSALPGSSNVASSILPKRSIKTVTSSKVSNMQYSLPKCTKKKYPVWNEIAESRKQEYIDFLSESSKSTYISENTGISKKASKVFAEATKECKYEAHVLTHGASGGTAKYPDAEFYTELREHNSSSKWNIPVRENKNKMNLEPYSKRKKHAAGEIRKKDPTLLLRMPKYLQKPIKETENILFKNEVLSEEIQLLDCDTANIGNSTSSSFDDSQVFKVEKNLQQPLANVINNPEPLGQMDSSSVRKSLESPKSTYTQYFHYTNTSATTEILPLVTDQTSVTNIKPVQEHSINNLEAVSDDPLSTNPIKFRQKLRNMPRSQSLSPPVVKKDSNYILGAIPKIRTPPSKESKTWEPTITESPKSLLKTG